MWPRLFSRVPGCVLSQLKGDVSAARGIGARRGAGRRRHIETRTVVVTNSRHAPRRSCGRLRRVATPPVDLGAKHLDQATMWKLP